VILAFFHNIAIALRHCHVVNIWADLSDHLVAAPESPLGQPGELVHVDQLPDVLLVWIYLDY